MLATGLRIKFIFEQGMCETEKQRTFYKILAYLAENPSAQDTLEGVVEWWLLEQRIRDCTAKTEEALAELVREGLVIERKGKDARSHYRVNRRKLRAIKGILNREFYSDSF